MTWALTGKMIFMVYGAAAQLSPLLVKQSLLPRWELTQGFQRAIQISKGWPCPDWTLSDCPNNSGYLQEITMYTYCIYKYNYLQHNLNNISIINKYKICWVSSPQLLPHVLIFGKNIYIYFFLEVQLIYNVVLASGVQQSDSVIYTHI